MPAPHERHTESADARAHPAWSKVKFASVDNSQALCERPQALVAPRPNAAPSSSSSHSSTPQRLSVSADTLFKFDRADAADVLEPGRLHIDRLIAATKGEAGIAHIQVTGHADRLGGDDHNLKLSTARAQTVREFLAARGLPAERIAHEGKGSSSPVVACTGAMSRTALIDCLAPNRRVEIEVTFTAPPIGEEQR